METVEGPEAGMQSIKQGGVVVPFGSTEWHRDLPLETDSLIAEAIAARVGEALSFRVLPVEKVGFSIEHRMFEGTKTLDAPGFLEMATEAVRSAASQARVVLVVNGHGGNSGLLEAACRTVRAELPSSKVFILEVWSAVDSLLSDLLGEGFRAAHAGVAEASLLFACRPELVPTRRPVEGLSASRRRPSWLTKRVWLATDLDTGEMEGYDPALGERLLSRLVSRTCEELLTRA